MSKAYDTFKENLKRTRNFIELYNVLTKELGRGRRNTPNTDVLRAGTVFLHSTLEEYLRTIIREKRLEAVNGDESSFESSLKDVSLPGDNTGRSEKKYSLKDLYSYRTLSVIEMIEKAVDDKCSMITFNDYSQIIAYLKTIGIDINTAHNKDAIIDTYIKRRHKIVHEADKNEEKGSGQFKTSAINANQLEKWINAVEGLVGEIEENLSQE